MSSPFPDDVATNSGGHATTIRSAQNEPVDDPVEHVHREPGEEERERAVPLVAEHEEGGGRRREGRSDGDVGGTARARGDTRRSYSTALDERTFAR